MMRYKASYNDDENAEDEREDPSEEAEPSEEELSGEDDSDGETDEEEEPYEIEFNERLESDEEEPNEDESCEEIAETESMEQEASENSDKRRRSRWAMGEGINDQAANVATKKRKTRWSSFESPDFANSSVFGTFSDPEYQKLYRQLHEINQKLNKEVPVADLPENARFPSPLPIYNDLGNTVNSTEVSIHADLIAQRQFIISELIKKKPPSKPPSNEPLKLCKKLYIPERDYPDCNFVGVIIGPHGCRLKKMEKETGARISIRGKSSLTEGKHQNYKDKKPEPWMNEDLHVYIEADSQLSIDAAEKMVEKLLVSTEATSKPPSNEPLKLSKKIYIPERDYPGYNFVGLIIGPRGRRQKMMEKETGARISIRGKSSLMEGKRRYYKDKKPELWKNEDLHVYIEADSQLSIDAAEKMVEKLLVPAETRELKSAQLKEFDLLKIKRRKRNSNAVQKKAETSDPCDVCGDASHLTSSCPLIASTPGTSTHDRQINFFAEVGSSGLSLFSRSPCPVPNSSQIARSPTHALSGSVTGPRAVNFLDEVGNCRVPLLACSSSPVSPSTWKANLLVQAPLSTSPWIASSSTHTLSGSVTGLHRDNFLTDVGDCSLPPSANSTLHVSTSTVNAPVHALPGSDGRHLKEIDEANLFIGCLPHSVNTNKLIELFLPFGRISEAKVVTDKSTGLSKGYGFVKYTDPIFAAGAVACMNRYRIDGKVLIVKVAHQPPSTVKSSLEMAVPPSFSRLPTYPDPAAFAQGKPASLGSVPARFMRPEPYTSFTKSNELPPHSQPVTFTAPSRIPVLPAISGSGSIAPSKELEHFSGYLKSFMSSSKHQTFFSHLKPPS
ncbi:uncharacterized protein [Typha angustifolia]|uniref:uncharacterized protein n=1 Tax=Typha angustifolia TaxID=59011 RepID=UPI003C2F2C47